MLGVKNSKLCEEHVHVFFCNALYIHRSGTFQNGEKPLGPEPFGSERLDMSRSALSSQPKGSSTCLKAELLEAEGQCALVFYCSVHTPA